MYLRKLQPKDAPLMLEWMHDESVVANLGTNFAAKTLTDCANFIVASEKDEHNLHLAIAQEDDTYMGTVSLKHIDRENCNAEFAITVRASAMGKGYSHYGMSSILNMAILEMGLKEVYWCVSPRNERAVRFYDKHNYCRTDAVPMKIRANYPADMPLIWYVYCG